MNAIIEIFLPLSLAFIMFSLGLGLTLDNLWTLGPAVVLLNALMLAIGYAAGAIFRLGPQRTATIAVEVGIQNATLGLTIGALLAPEAEGLSAYALPSGVYGVLMYVVSLPAIAWMRTRSPAVTDAAG